MDIGPRLMVNIKTSRQAVSSWWFVRWGGNQTKTEKDISTPPTSPSPRTGSPVAGASPSYSTRANCSLQQHQPEAAIRVDGTELRLVQNTVKIN